MQHELKTWPEYFQDIIAGKKPFDLRKNDRDFKEGDILKLVEYDPRSYEFSGRVCYRRVTYVMEEDKFGAEKGFVVMGIEVVDACGTVECDKIQIEKRCKFLSFSSEKRTTVMEYFGYIQD